MALLRHIKTQWVVTLTLFVFLGLSSTGNGVKQEIYFHLREGGALYFDVNKPDFTSFANLLPQINQTCITGTWLFSTVANYPIVLNITGTNSGNTPLCLNEEQLNATRIKSFRHFAAGDTSTSAISLYTGKNYHIGELLVTGQAMTNIISKYNSLAISGPSDWMLFEGPNLDGRSVCYRKDPGTYLNWNTFTDNQINLDTVRSVFKGCNFSQIQAYRKLHLL